MQKEEIMNKQELDEKIIDTIESIEAHVDMNYDMCAFDKKAYLLDITQACAKHFFERIEKKAISEDEGSIRVVVLDDICKIFDSTTQDKK